MSTYDNLPLGVRSFIGDEDDNTVVADGVRTESGTGPAKTYTYSYGVYDVRTLGGNDTIYLRNITAIDPDGVNPDSRQHVDGGAGNDYVFVSSLTAATLIGGDGDDTLVKTDLRSFTGGNPVENGVTNTAPGGKAPDGLKPDPLWTDFDIFDAGDGNDTIVTGNGPDWVYAGTGDDWMSLGSGTNVAFAGAGADTIIVEGLNYDKVLGAIPPMAQTFYAAGSNTIWAGDGNDIVSIRWVQDGANLSSAVNGEGGDDTITVSSTSSSWITGGDGNDLIALDDLRLAYANGNSISQALDTIYGDAGNDVIYAGNGGDTLVGGADHDWIFGEYGSDLLYGGNGGGVDDMATDRFSFGNYRHQDFSQTFASYYEDDIDSIFDFRPASAYGDATGKSDKIDLAQLISENSFLTYDAGNPFLQGELRLQDFGSGVSVQASDGAGGWITFLNIFGVYAADLDITVQGDVSGGLAAATGGDFIWYTG